MEKVGSMGKVVKADWMESKLGIYMDKDPE